MQQFISESTAREIAKAVYDAQARRGHFVDDDAQEEMIAAMASVYGPFRRFDTKPFASAIDDVVARKIRVWSADDPCDDWRTFLGTRARFGRHF